MFYSLSIASVYCTSFSHSQTSFLSSSILSCPLFNCYNSCTVFLNSFNIIQYTLLQLNTFRLEAQLRNITSKSFDALNDKNTVEYESINPEEFTSMFLDKNEGIYLILKIEK